jgi:prephenate dehydrogenase
VTRDSRTSLSALRQVSHFWKKLGCRVETVTVEEHDRLAATLSHFPHVAASLLVLQAGRRIDCAGTGFKDMTRIVCSDPLLWHDILSTNRSEILKSIRLFQKRLAEIEKLLTAKKNGAILNKLKTAKQLRDRLEPPPKASRPAG